MATTASNVRVATTGGIYFTDDDTAELPIAVTDTLDAKFDEVGYVSEDGVTETINSTTNRIRAWQNGDIVREVETEHDYTLQFTMIETNETSLAIYYGNHEDGLTEVKAGQKVRGLWVFDFKDGDDLVTIAVPDGEVTARESINRRAGDPTSYGVTVTCYPDEEGVKARIYTGSEGS
jgi:hypothetical protein